jgi:hypothetical protein
MVHSVKQFQRRKRESHRGCWWDHILRSKRFEAAEAHALQGQFHRFLEHGERFHGFWKISKIEDGGRGREELSRELLMRFQRRNAQAMGYFQKSLIPSNGFWQNRQP